MTLWHASPWHLTFPCCLIVTHPTYKGRCAVLPVLCSTAWEDERYEAVSELLAKDYDLEWRLEVLEKKVWLCLC